MLSVLFARVVPILTSAQLRLPQIEVPDAAMAANHEQAKSAVILTAQKPPRPAADSAGNESKSILILGR
jgi:hypothetical protein